MGTWPSKLGILKFETVMVMSPAGFRPEKDCTGEAQQEL
jgi:hypothetical protein